MHRDNEKIDAGLKENYRIEEAIEALQRESSYEMLAHTLTVIRRTMTKKAQMIIAVEPPRGDNQIRLQVVETPDGKKWWAAFTSFDEEMKGGNQVMSTFLADMDQLLKSSLSANDIEGVIFNPWNKTIMLNKKLINIVLGNIV